MARQRKSEFTVICIKVLWDIVVIAFSLYFSFWLRFYSGFVSTPLGIPTLSAYSSYFPIIILLFIVIMHNFGLYSKQLISQHSLGLIQLWKSITVSLLFIMALNFAVRFDQQYSRIMLIFFWGSTIIFLSIGRAIIRWAELSLFTQWHKKIKVLIVGTGEVTNKLILSSKKYLHWRRVVIGLIGEKNAIHSVPEFVPILGELKDFTSILEKYPINEVILTNKGLDHSTIVNMILECEKRLISFKMVPDMFEILTSQVDIESFDGIPILGLKEFPLEKVYNRMQKRSLDICGSFFGLVILFPVMFLIAVVVKLSSKGPVFYKQVRVGENGKKFTIIKFRTMIYDAEKASGPIWAKEKDERRTKYGAFLREYNLDELPQLWNVLRGEMSLVGPRPERPNFVAEFKEDFPRYMSRHQIKSGMTGWAQVNGLRGNTSIEERLKYDMYYLENWSILLDIKIILMTFLSRKNAY